MGWSLAVPDWQVLSRRKQIAVGDDIWALLDSYPGLASSGRTPIRTAKSLNSKRSSNRLRAMSSTSESGTLSSVVDKRRPRTRIAFKVAKP
jgi:hypothetical protein